MSQRYKTISRIALLVSMALMIAPRSGRAGDPVAWLCLATEWGITPSNGPVSNWVDICDNGAWMTIASRQPQVIPGAINGYPVVRFSGAQSLLLTKPINSTQFTIFVVGRNSMPTETFSMILGPGGSYPNNQLRWENGSQALAVGTGNGMPATTAPIGDTRIYHLLTIRYDGAVLSFYRNGALFFSRSMRLSSPWALAQIGAWYSSYFMKGDLAEIKAYNTAVPDSYRAYMDSYLVQKYALQ